MKNKKRNALQEVGSRIQEGSHLMMKNGLTVEILRINGKECDIQFEENTILQNENLIQVLNGTVELPVKMSTNGLKYKYVAKDCGNPDVYIMRCIYDGTFGTSTRETLNKGLISHPTLDSTGNGYLKGVPLEGLAFVGDDGGPRYKYKDGVYVSLIGLNNISNIGKANVKPSKK